MNLLPFGSYRHGSGAIMFIQCPMCQRSQAEVNLSTRYCVEGHLTGRPQIKTTTLGDTSRPHLHRTCARCGYEWLEETAPS